jgi:endonuclease/exonuclease/phosphatase family metal-dependent hydrolase
VRAAQWLRLSLPEGHLDVINTHLSLHFLERLTQARALFSDDPALPEVGREAAPFAALSGTLDRLILCGDFNSGALSPIYFWLRHRLLDAQRAGGRSARATWPARCPLLRLDHVWLGKDLRVERVEVPKSGTTRLASDHLPIVVDVTIGPPTKHGGAEIERNEREIGRSEGEPRGGEDQDWR